MVGSFDLVDLTRVLTLRLFRKRGEEFFATLYGETTGIVRPFLNEIYPDMGGDFFMSTVGYGYIYSYTDILSPAETSLCYRDCGDGSWNGSST
ncbi:hypothetical protein L218DRAFT_1080624 [Marasmius fiardii PR-910]|nr:hypothetical protein L218DRAFT_1080624 [Marasmius fiardii PR-910]